MEEFEQSTSNPKVYKRPKKPKVPLIKKNLSIFIASLQGIAVVVDLKDDSDITGIVEEASNGMNIVLVGAQHSFPDGHVDELEVAYILGSSIRYVHFPPHINPASHLSSYLKKTERIVKQSKPHQIIDRTKRGMGVDDSGEFIGTEEGELSGFTSRKRPAKEIFMSYGNEFSDEEEQEEESNELEAAVDSGSSEDHNIDREDF